MYTLKYYLKAPFSLHSHISGKAFKNIMENVSAVLFRVKMRVDDYRSSLIIRSQFLMWEGVQGEGGG